MSKFATPVIDIKKYGGKEVALVRGKIIVSGRSTRAVLKRAKKLVPLDEHNQIWLFRVPKSLAVIYRLA